MTNKTSAIIIRPKPLRLGAEELDIESGISFYKQIFSQVIVISVDQREQFKWETTYFTNQQFVENQVLPKVRPTPPYRVYFKYLILKTLILDRHMRSNLNLELCKQIHELSRKEHTNLVITETSSLFLLSLFSIGRRYSRSVNFEPLHALSEIGCNLRGIYHFLSKWSGAIIEANFSNVLSVSPRDLRLYRYISVYRQHKLWPLRHLITSTKFEFNGEFSTQRFGVLVSTFNVPHNSRNVEFLCQQVFSTEPHNTLVIYGSKVPDKFNTKNVQVKGWVDNIDEIYQETDVFLASYQGGTGMQSKVFEPLSRNKIVICDPKLLRGWSLLPNLHYIPASTPKEFSEAMNSIKTNPDRGNEIRKTLKLWVEQNFEQDFWLKEIYSAFKL